MSIDLKVTNDDLVRVNGKTVLTSNLEEIKQSIKNRLLTRKGEFFIDTEYGLEYDNVFSTVNKNLSNETVELEIRTCILQDSRVDTVDVEVLKKEKDTLYINFKAVLLTQETIEGGVEIV